MTVSWRVKNSKMVVWQTPSSGDVMASFTDPVANLDRIWLCSDFDYYQTAFDQNVTLSHPAVSGGSTTLGGDFTIAGHYVETDLAVLTHNLGYIPRFKVAIGAELIPNGWAIQTPAGGDNGARLVSFYATTTEIRCSDMGWATASTLAAKSRPSPSPCRCTGFRSSSRRTTLAGRRCRRRRASGLPSRSG